MNDSEKDVHQQADAAIEQQIRLEKAREASIKAEMKQEKQRSRAESKREVRRLAKKIPLKGRIIGMVIFLLLLIVLFGIALPVVFNSHPTRYFAESDLEEAVNIENLSTVEYVYHGIAEKEGKFLWADTIEYRVKYEAHVQAYYDMSLIRFQIDRDNSIVTALLPAAEIGTPVLDETKFGYLPDRATANMKDVLALCRADATSELDSDTIRAESAESLKNTVEALTAPLLGTQWTLEFADLSEKSQEGSEEDVA